MLKWSGVDSIPFHSTQLYSIAIQVLHNASLNWSWNFAQYNKEHFAFMLAWNYIQAGNCLTIYINKLNLNG